MAVVYLDAGHAKVTAGKRSPDSSLMEWEFNIYMARLLETELKRCGISTLMINPNPESGPDMRLSARAGKANTSWRNAGKPSALYVSFHANAEGDYWGSAHGTETYTYFFRSAGSSVTAAKYVQQEIVNAIGTRDRGVKEADFAVLRETAMPAILIEYAFYSNRNECAMLKDHSKRKQMAIATAKGICKYFGVTYKPESGGSTGGGSSNGGGFVVGDLNKTVTVTADVLNVRSGRGAENPKIGQLVRGDKVTIWTVGKAKDGSLWGSFRYNPEHIGFIHMGYVRL